jgi:hypothetical protein
MKDRRIGKFYIRMESIENDPNMVLETLDGIIIVRAEQRFDFDAIEYIGISKYFDVCSIGTIVPEYVPMINTDMFGIKSFKEWKKL